MTATSSRIRAVDVFPVSCTLPRPVGDGQGLQAVRQSAFVRVTLEDGTYGWGEGGGPVPGASLIRNRLGPAILGMDARDTDLIHARLVAMRAPRGTLGAIDIALWDARGKLAGMPVYQLLGGARRDRVPAYASLHNYSASVDCSDELRKDIAASR